MAVDQTLLAQARQAHRDVFSRDAVDVVVSPGRVNLIGEHTDYNEGYVLPLAIDRHTLIAFSPRTDRTVRLWSASFAKSVDDVVEIEIDAVGSGGANGGRAPADYARGVVHALMSGGEDLGIGAKSLRGCDMAVVSNLPIGASLSSSASFELAVIRALVASTPGAQFVPQTAIMDQMVCAAALAGHALLLDCRDLTSVNVPLAAGLAVVVLDTGKRRELAGSEYNVRRQQCETAARLLGVSSLREASIELLHSKKAELDDVIYRRARHVIGENDRTIAAAMALRTNDLAMLGELMRASHASLRDDYEVSVRELDLMAEIANAHAHVVGARMTGGGFGGCAVAVVDASVAGQVERFCVDVEAAYRARSACVPAVYACVASDGTHLLAERAS